MENNNKTVNYVQTTPFSLMEKIKARIWAFINRSIFRLTPWFLRGVRRQLLRMFGATIDNNVSIHQTATINYPWRLKIGSFASIGEGAYVDCLDFIEIQEYAIVGQFTTLLTGSHDLIDTSFNLVTLPIQVKYGAWICTKAIVLPGVVIGERSVIGAGSVVTKNIPNDVIAVGNPCRVIKNRELNDGK